MPLWLKVGGGHILDFGLDVNCLFLPLSESSRRNDGWLFVLVFVEVDDNGSEVVGVDVIVA